MTQVIENLLIGVGLETDQRSFQNAESSLDGLKSKALQVGAVMAGAFGVGALTFGFAEKTDELGKFSERWNIAANDVSAYDRALGLAGGTQGEFLGTVRNLSKALTLAPFERAQLLGEVSKFRIGDQVNEVLNAKDALDAFLTSSDQLNSLQGKQREKFIETMGFGESEVRLLSTGREEILKVVSAQQKMAPVTKQMTDTAAKFNDEWQNLTTNVSGFSDRVAEPLTASIANIIVGMNDWIGKNREVINSLLEFGGGTVADNIEVITAALLLFGSAKVLGGVSAIAGRLGSISTSAGSATSKVAGLAKGLGVLGAALIAESLVSDFVNDNVGKNSTADFLANYLSDQAIGGLLGSLMPGGGAEGLMPTPRSFGQTSAFPVTSGRASQKAQAPTQTIKVDVMLDGEPVKAITKQVIQEQNAQLINDFSTSNGG